MAANPSLIVDVVMEDVDDEFVKEYGIVDIIPTGAYWGGGHPECQILFKSESYKSQFQSDYN